MSFASADPLRWSGTKLLEDVSAVFDTSTACHQPSILFYAYATRACLRSVVTGSVVTGIALVSNLESTTV